MTTTAPSEITKAKAARAAADRKPRVRLFVTRHDKVRVVDSELRDRLVQGAYAADAGEATDTTGMSDDEFLALLRR